MAPAPPAPRALRAEPRLVAKLLQLSFNSTPFSFCTFSVS
jgi:hypothetical protein